MVKKERKVSPIRPVIHECQFRELMDRIGDKWSMLIILTLEKSPNQRLRFSELRKVIPGISQRMLTTSLRALERDGIMARHHYPEVPPRVEYELTSLGRNLMTPMRGLFTWLESNWASIQEAREKYDKNDKLKNKKKDIYLRS